MKSNEICFTSADNTKNYVITAALFFANGLKTSVNQCALNKTVKRFFIITVRTTCR